MNSDIVMVRVPLNTPTGIEADVRAAGKAFANQDVPRRLVSTVVAGDALLLFFELVEQ